MPIDKILFQLLAKALNEDYCLDPTIFENVDWEEVMSLASKQGVNGLAFDALESIPIASRPNRNLLLKWLGQSVYIEKVNDGYAQTVIELADKLTVEGVRVVVLKGLACASWYPNPLHRNSGDFDCFLCGDFDKGNDIALKIGSKLNRGYYKHSEFIYKKVNVENHRFMLNIRGNKNLKALEKHLHELLYERQACEHEYVTDSNIEIPCANFNALFLLVHTFTHFMDEGVKLKQLCDWAMFLKQNQDKVNWHEFYSWTERLRMKRFACAITDIAVRYLGVNLRNTDVIIDDTYSDRILVDALYESESIHNKGYSHVRKLYVLAKSMLKNNWKYKDIYQKNATLELIRMGWFYAVERNPQIE